MTKEKVLNNIVLESATADIPLVFLRYLESRTNERVLEVVLVYDGVDRFDTVIEPRGMKTDPSIVIVDYNHKRVSTGAYLKNVRVETDYKIQNGSVLKEALVGEIHIPEDSEMFYHNREGEKKTNGNLFEAVSKGQIQSVSVEFRPYKGKQKFDTRTGITTYQEWDLISLSLLDVAPGQPYSGIKITRSIINQNRMSIDEIKKAIANGEITTEDLKSLLSMESESEDENENEIIKDTPPTETPKPDQNGDGEISDEEMRSYVKDLKRAFGDNPAMVNDKIEEIKRQIEVISNPMKKEEAPAENTEAKPPIEVTRSQEEEKSDEDKEIERLRSLNLIQNLENIPEVKESKVVNVARQFGDEEEGVKEENKEVEVKLTYKEKVMLNQIYNN
jgi:hypothetical protein